VIEPKINSKGLTPIWNNFFKVIEPKINSKGLTPIWARPWVLVVLILLVYANSWGNPFILDDVTHIQDNQRLARWDNWTEVFSSPFFEFKEVGLAQYYRPLVKLTYKIERFFFGVNPFGYHLVNTTFHCINTLLLYLICRLLVGSPGPAFIAALIFGIHPLQTEEVSYISGLGGLGAVGGILASLYFFLRFRISGRFWWYPASVFIFMVGLLFKESALILPVMLGWLILIFRPNRDKPAGWLPGGLLYIIPYILCLGGYLYLRSSFLVKTDFLAGMNEGLWIRFLTFGKGLWIYLGLYLFPLHLHFYRSLELLPHGWHILPLLLLGTTAVFLIKAAGRSGRSSLLGAIGFGWFLLALLPFSGITPIFLEGGFLFWAEHFMYLSLAGLGMLSAGILSGFWSAGTFRPAVRMIAVVCAILIVISLGMLTVRQNSFWSDELVFFERMNKYEPDLFRTAGLLGIAYLKRGRVAAAIRADIHARDLLLLPYGSDPSADLSSMDKYMLKIILWRISRSYRMLKQYGPAADTAREFVAIYPDGYEGKYLLGRALSEGGDNAGALPYLEAAYQLRQDNFEVVRSLIICYQNLGEFERAKKIWSAASRRIPEFRKAKEILKNRNRE